GVTGELFLGGVGLARGYQSRPGRTAAYFVPDPFAEHPGERLYRTGDLTRQRQDGAVDYLGRADTQVKIRGFRIELGEIEAALENQTGIRQAVVVARDGRLDAYCVPARGSGLDVSTLRAALAKALPDFMLPATFTALSEIPRLANGKTDRRSLPAPGPERPALATAMASPRNRVEGLLAELWARVLRLDQVGIHDNFFELGGDSILTIRIVSRAAQRGLRFTPRDLFQHQTVDRLATVAQAAAVPTSDQGAIVGPVPLLPIQHWFFERDWSQPWHYNWAAVWSTPRPLAFAPLLRAVERLEGHHDALRLRFRRHDDGWRQRIARPAATRAASWIDLSRLDGVEAGDDIEAIVQQAAAHLQPSLDLASGPIFRAVYFGAGRGRPSLLLLMVHHLAVDGVSWGLLRQDFVAAYRHEERAPSGGVAAKQPLPAKTTSFKAWAEHLVQAAGGAASQRAAEHWLAFNRSPSPLPVDFEEGENSVASTATVTVSLDVGETRELLRSLPTTQHARVDEVLLTALAAALCRFIGSTRLRIDLEGHGRQGDLESSRRPTEAPLDLSRTVGWLTTLFPVVLDLGDPSDSAGHRLRTVKQQLRAIPNVGLDFGIQRYLRAADQRRPLEELPCSEVLFNYLGQGDRADEDEEALLGESTIEVGARQSPEGRRSHLLEILATVRGETLQMHWRYSRRRHRRATIEALAKDFLGELRHLLDPNLTAPGTGLLPSDFPLADIGSATLDRLTAAWAGEIEDIYRTSPTQEALFYYDLYHPASEAYIEHMTVSLHGRLDLARLHRAGQRLLERHPVLRTALVWEGLEEPRQVVLRQVELPWTEEDWRHLPPAEQQRRFQALIRQDRRHGFDLRQAPLIRWTVARLSNETHRLMWCYHHVILDGWSMPLLVREAFELYLADGPIASPPRPFRDYLAWRAERKTARAEVFWRRSLEGVTAATPLPFDRPLDREDAPARIETVGVRLGDRAADLGALARHRRLTLNTLIQAAWSLTLGAFSGEEEVIFGATLAARPGEIEGVERMVGLFINTLPVRLSVAPHGRLGDLLARLQSWNVEMRQFDDSRLFDLHAWSDIPRGQPIFNSAILFQNYPHQPSSDLAALGLSPSGYRSFGTTSYPLTLTVKPTDGFNVSLAYDARRFDRSTAARLLAATRHLLELFVADADQALAALATLPPAARHQVLTEWNDTASIGDAPPPWSELFRRQVEQAPDRLAVESAEGSLTYGELGRRVEHLARHLRSLGVAREARVGLLMVRTPEMVTSMLAILRAGAAYVPLDPLYPRERMAFILAECGAAAVLTLERLVDDLPPLEVPVLQVDRDWAGIPRRQAAVWPEPAVGQLAYVIYTSGSTGRPKGVAIAERALTTYALDAAAQLAIRPSDRMLQFASISFDTSAEEIFPTLVRGATLRLRTEPMLESPAVFLDTCARWRITLLDLPTAYWHELTTSFARRPLAMPPTLRWVIIGGESARADDLVAWQRHAGDPVRLLNTYGPTEATIVATRRELTAAIDASPLVSIGNAIPRAAAHVVDRWLRSVPVGVAGELVLAGAGLARGYLERPRHTARSFVPNPLGAAPGERLYKTGDRVRRRADADLLFLGRFDHQVKVRGLRIELGEIERALETSAEIADAVVTVRASSGLGKADRGERPHLVAYVVLATSTGSEPTPASLRAHLKTSLPFYMLPAAFVVLGAFPM
ncbi:MAG: amino acid adenylation domain-containing protein, partial [Acidobacteriota bacterium]